MLVDGEELLSRSLRTVLADVSIGARVDDCDEFKNVLIGLDIFIPVVLREIHPEWSQEWLDGILPVLARKSAEGEAEIFGLGFLMSDQTLAPLHVRLQVADSSEEVPWLECRIGERGEHGMVRTPYASLNKMSKRLIGLEGNFDRIEWAYKVTFGEQLR